MFEVGVLTSLVVTIVLVALDHINFGRKPFVLILHSESNIEEELIDLFKTNRISNKFKSRNYTSKGYDYAIEFTYKDINGLQKELSKNKNISKYSIIEYDADDIV